MDGFLGLGTSVREISNKPFVKQIGFTADSDTVQQVSSLK